MSECSKTPYHDCDLAKYYNKNVNYTECLVDQAVRCGIQYAYNFDVMEHNTRSTQFWLTVQGIVILAMVVWIVLKNLGSL